MGFGEKRGFSTNFCPYYSMAMWRLWAKKLINTISAEFGVFPSKNHDSIVFMQFCKNHRVTFREMNSTCQNTLGYNHIFMGY